MDRPLQVLGQGFEEAQLQLYAQKYIELIRYGAFITLPPHHCTAGPWGVLYRLSQLGLRDRM